MKHHSFFQSHTLQRSFWAALALTSFTVLSSCSDDDDPVQEDVPELITKVELTFTPAGGGTAVVVTATDPDGEGTDELTADGPINLATGVTYTLGVKLYNGLLPDTDDDYNVTEEVKEESDEHMFFFAWSNGLFASPEGDGNIDNRAHAVNYSDEDENGLPIGLITSWTAGANALSEGNFRVVLKHQPDLKSATSGYTTGETDVDVSFVINVAE
jgi:hypothetical protein